MYIYTDKNSELEACPDCGKSTGVDSYKKMKQHYIDDHTDIRLKYQPEWILLACSLCDNISMNPTKAASHRSQQHSIFLCKFCAQPFKRKEMLQHHIFLHSPNYFYWKCDGCQILITSASALGTHLKTCDLTAYKGERATRPVHRLKNVYDEDYGKNDEVKIPPDWVSGVKILLQEMMEKYPAKEQKRNYTIKTLKEIYMNNLE